MTQATSASAKSSCGPTLLIAMAVIVVVGILAFLIFRSGGTGNGTQNSPANTHTLLRAPLLQAPFFACPAA